MIAFPNKYDTDSKANFKTLAFTPVHIGNPIALYTTILKRNESTNKTNFFNPYISKLYFKATERKLITVH